MIKQRRHDDIEQRVSDGLARNAGGGGGGRGLDGRGKHARLRPLSTLARPLDTRAGATRPTHGRTTGRSGDALPLFHLLSAGNGEPGRRWRRKTRSNDAAATGGVRVTCFAAETARGRFITAANVYTESRRRVPANRARLRHAAKIFTPVRTSRFPAIPSTPSNSTHGRPDYSMTSRTGVCRPCVPPSDGSNVSHLSKSLRNVACKVCDTLPAAFGGNCLKPFVNINRLKFKRKALRRRFVMSLKLCIWYSAQWRIWKSSRGEGNFNM